MADWRPRPDDPFSLPLERDGSPGLGRSMRRMVAPWLASIMAQNGPGPMPAKLQHFDARQGAITCRTARHTAPPCARLRINLIPH